MRLLKVLAGVLIAFILSVGISYAQYSPTAKQITVDTSGYTKLNNTKTNVKDVLADIDSKINTASSLTGQVPLENGGTGLSSASDDTTIISNGTAWQSKTIPSCTDSGGNHLNYDQSSNSFSCGTSVGAVSLPTSGVQVFADPSQNLSTVISNIVSSGVATQLNLAPGTYSACDLTISSPVNISIVGSGKSTILNCVDASASHKIFNISGQNLTSYLNISNLSLNISLTGAYNAFAIYIIQSGASQTILNSNVNFSNLYIKAYSSNGEVRAIYTEDVGFNAENLDVICVGEGTTSNEKCIWPLYGTGLDSNITTNLRNIKVSSGTGSNSSSYAARALDYYMDFGDHGGYTVAINNYNVDAYAYQYVNGGGERVACYCVNDGNAGTGTLSCNFYGGTCGSDYRAVRTTATNNGQLNTIFNGTALYGGASYFSDLIQSGGSNTNRYYKSVIPVLSLFNASSNLVTRSDTNSVTGVGTDLINLTGQQGANNPTASGSVSAGIGALVSITAGAGGAATSTTGAGTAGDGGFIRLKPGAGGAQTNASGTNNTGGAGGILALYGGDGGVANSGSGTQTGGAGGSIYLKPGAGGVGTSTTGANGNVFLAVNSPGTVTGNVMIRSNTVPNGPLVVTPPSSQTISAGSTITDDGCGTIKPITSSGAVTTGTTNTFTAPAAGNNGCCMDVVNVGANNITLDNNANFVSFGAGDVVMTANDAVRVCSTGASGKWYQITPLEAN